MSLAAAAAAGEADKPLRTATAHFAAPVAADTPITMSVREIAAGRSRSTFLVEASQDGRLVLAGMFGFFAPGDSPVHEPAGTRPHVPGPDACARYTAQEAVVPMARLLDIRPATPVLPLSGSDEAELVAWVRLRGHDVVDSRTALVLLDSLAPALYATLAEPVPVPSVELSAHLVADLDAAPAQGWVLIRQRNSGTRDGISIDETDVWDEHGRLLAQARQARKVLKAFAAA
jgi:acyl-CoA thioesterase